MKKFLNLLSGILLFITSITALIVSVVINHFTPEKERIKGLMTYPATKATAAYYNCRAWLYELFSRWHIDSCSHYSFS